MMSKEPKILFTGHHEFSGECAPKEKDHVCTYTTFSVGIYEIVLASNKKKTKRGPVKVRVKGLIAEPEKVYEKAREIADLLTKGEYKGPKLVSVI
jgi:hypothetical protein